MVRSLFSASSRASLLLILVVFLSMLGAVSAGSVLDRAIERAASPFTPLEGADTHAEHFVSPTSSGSGDPRID